MLWNFGQLWELSSISHTQKHQTGQKKCGFLVAYDEHAIKRLWRKVDDGVEGNETANPQSMLPSNAFLDKTFQIQFKVPLPLLSDWLGFLKEQLKRAFPKGEDVEFYKISRIYEILIAGIRPPTPRNIITFVNQIGAAYRTSEEQITLSQLGLFVALSDSEAKGPDFSKEIQNPSPSTFGNQ